MISPYIGRRFNRGDRPRRRGLHRPLHTVRAITAAEGDAAQGPMFIGNYRAQNIGNYARVIDFRDA